jgi:hypothetical protein
MKITPARIATEAKNMFYVFYKGYGYDWCSVTDREDWLRLAEWNLRRRERLYREARSTGRRMAIV